MAFDFYKLDSQLTEKQRLLKQQVDEYVDQIVLPSINPFWEKAEFPRDLVMQLKHLPIMGGVIKDFGCSGLSLLELGLVMKELAKGDGSLATFYGVHCGLAMGSIELLGSDEQRERWLPSMASLEKIGAFALTEPNHGSDVINMETKARMEGTEYVLNGHKRWIGNASISDLMIVWAKDGNGDLGGFVIENPQQTKGVEIHDIQGKRGLRAILNADVHLKQVRIPIKNRLPKVKTFVDIATILKLGRFAVSWEAAGLAEGAFEHALAYAQKRVQFSRPIASYQLIQEKLVEMAAEVTAMQLICFQLAHQLEADAYSEGMLSLAKYHNAAKARHVTRMAAETLGGNGLLLENHIARLAADAEAIYIYEGTNEMNLLLVGKELTGFSAI